MAKRVCDICGQETEKGLCAKPFGKWLPPWKKRVIICEKCKEAGRLLILQQRRRRDI